MNNIRKYLTYMSLVAVFLIGAIGCSDDFFTPGSKDDGLCHMRVVLPSIDYKRTRGYGSNQEPVNNDVLKESHIESLFLFTFDTEGDKHKMGKVNSEPVELTSEYKEFDFSLKPGKYRIYAVANVEEIEKKFDENTLEDLSEKEFLELCLKYKEDVLPAPGADKGLPMLGILDSEKGGSVYEAKSGDSEEYIDMAFLCSKVRFTLLFDNTATDGSNDNVGFSNPAFGAKTIRFTGVRAENVADRAYVVGDAIYDVFGLKDNDVVGGRNSLEVTPFNVASDKLPQGHHCAYPDSEDVDDFLNTDGWTDRKDGNSTITNDGVACNTSLTLTPIGDDELDHEKRRAYQGVLYLPENMNVDSPTTLYFTAECEGVELEYEVTLPSPAGKKSEVSDEGKEEIDDLLHGQGFAPHVEGALQRGHFYDLIGKVKDFGGKLDVTLSVKDWSIEPLVYDLQVPYFLHLQKTDVEVRAGENTVMWYDSDATSLELVSPKYNGGELDLYVMDKTTYPDSLIITVNPRINADLKINQYDDNHNYFYLKAGNLYKKIKVNPLSLAPFLNVTPGIVTFDVREMIGSGVYDKEQPLKITTNLPNVKVEYADDSSAWTDVDGLVSTEVGEQSIAAGSKELSLFAKGINEGKDFWKKEQTLKLKFTALTEDGEVAKEGGKDLIREVTIKTYPNNLDYKIHFYGKGWTHPHIYVYQCLELPNDAVATIKGVKTPVGGMTVGATYDDGYVSALQYSFTGKIAFKGWDYTPGSVNNPNGDGTVKDGFFLFSNNNNLWHPDNDTQQIHYYRDRDLCKEHRDKLGDSCPQCTGPNYARNWPGIMMLRGNKVVDSAEDTWWDFDLTGIATPGKALIMFADAHQSTTGLRYPGHLEVGVPLFDYPSREGWFVYEYNDNNFVSTKPNFSGLPRSKYRIYWPDRMLGYSGMNMYNAGVFYKEEVNTEEKLGYENGWWYTEFIGSSDYNNASLSYNYQEKNAWSGTASVKLSDFKPISGDYSGLYCYTITDLGSGYSGVPSSAWTKLKKGEKVRIRWKKSFYYDNIHVWVMAKDKYQDETNWGTSGYYNGVREEGDYYTFDFDLFEDNVSCVGYILRNGTGNTGNRYFYYRDIEKHYDSSLGRYVFTIDAL